MVVDELGHGLNFNDDLFETVEVRVVGIFERITRIPDALACPANEPLAVVSYAAGQPVEAYYEPLAAGASLPDMPLFLQVDRYVNVPLEAAYQSALRGEPFFWRRGARSGLMGD